MSHNRGNHNLHHCRNHDPGNADSGNHAESQRQESEGESGDRRLCCNPGRVSTAPCYGWLNHGTNLRSMPANTQAGDSRFPPVTG